MKFDITVEGEYSKEAMMDDCENGNMLDVAVGLKEWETYDEDDKIAHFQTILTMFDPVKCPKCGHTGIGLIVKSNDVHKVRTVCLLCHGFIKHGFPFKYRGKK